jgi:hypothetical protein
MQANLVALSREDVLLLCRARERQGMEVEDSMKQAKQLRQRRRCVVHTSHVPTHRAEHTAHTLYVRIFREKEERLLMEDFDGPLRASRLRVERMRLSMRRTHELPP